MFDRDYIEPAAPPRVAAPVLPIMHVRRCLNGCNAPARARDVYCDACHRAIEFRTWDDVSEAAL